MLLNNKAAVDKPMADIRTAPSRCRILYKMVGPSAVTLLTSTPSNTCIIQKSVSSFLEQWVQGQAKAFKQFCLEQAALNVTPPAFRPSNFVSVQEAVMDR